MQSKHPGEGTTIEQNASSTLRVAAVQVESRDFDVLGNLRRAESLVADAGERGAELVLCPELMAAGYIYDAALWDAAEPRGGPTEAWLARMARRHGIYIGASYLEASGDDFFNTFTLEAGRLARRAGTKTVPARLRRLVIRSPS